MERARRASLVPLEPLTPLLPLCSPSPVANSLSKGFTMLICYFAMLALIFTRPPRRPLFHQLIMPATDALRQLTADDYATRIPPPCNETTDLCRLQNRLSRPRSAKSSKGAGGPGPTLCSHTASKPTISTTLTRPRLSSALWLPTTTKPVYYGASREPSPRARSIPLPNFCHHRVDSNCSAVSLLPETQPA